MDRTAGKDVNWDLGLSTQWPSRAGYSATVGWQNNPPPTHPKHFFTPLKESTSCECCVLRTFFTLKCITLMKTVSTNGPGPSLENRMLCCYPYAFHLSLRISLDALARRHMNPRIHDVAIPSPPSITTLLRSYYFVPSNTLRQACRPVVPPPV